MTGTKIIDERYMAPALAAVPPGLRQAIAAAADYRWNEEQDDYLDNCSNEPGDNQRAGHPFEAMTQLRRWLEGGDDTRVDTAIWVTSPEPAPGGYRYLTETRRKTIREVHAELLAVVGARDTGSDGSDTGSVTVPGADDYFGVYPAADAGQAWPDGRIVVFSVTGGSEGWYVHVEVQTTDKQSLLLILGKGFDGADASWALARRLAGVLGV